MKYITLKTRRNTSVTIFIGTGSIVVHEDIDGNVTVLDGIHNNGGWEVKETYAEVIAMILACG
jgi:hypothetical protein